MRKPNRIGLAFSVLVVSALLSICFYSIAQARVLGENRYCEEINSIPGNVMHLYSGRVVANDYPDIDVYTTKIGGRTIVVEISTELDLLVSFFIGWGRNASLVSHLCFLMGSVTNGRPVYLKIDNLWIKKTKLTASNNESNVEYDVKLYSTGEAVASHGKIIKVPMYVFTFENAPLKRSAKSHAHSASVIWHQAGIELVPYFKYIRNDKAKTLIGDDLTLQGFFGSQDADSEPSYTERKNLRALKRKPKSLGLFFVKSDLTARADPYNDQVYMPDDVSPVLNPPVGRTVAHEIGHLLLGEGHTGNSGVPWKSGLMRAGTSSNSASLHDDDIKVARTKALQLPGAKYID